MNQTMSNVSEGIQLKFITLTPSSPDHFEIVVQIKCDITK